MYIRIAGNDLHSITIIPDEVIREWMDLGVMTQHCSDECPIIDTKKRIIYGVSKHDVYDDNTTYITKTPLVNDPLLTDEEHL